MITLRRVKKTRAIAMGTLTGLNIGTYFTLENAMNLLPDGVYQVEVNYSPKFRSLRPHIWNENVIAARGFRIHEGNTVKDSEGCVLIGNGANLTTRKLTESKAALAQLMGELARLGGRCELTIITEA